MNTQIFEPKTNIGLMLRRRKRIYKRNLLLENMEARLALDLNQKIDKIKKMRKKNKNKKTIEIKNHYY